MKMPLSYSRISWFTAHHALNAWHVTHAHLAYWKGDSFHTLMSSARSIGLHTRLNVPSLLLDY